MLRCFTYLLLQFAVGSATAQHVTTITYSAKDGLLDDRVTAITKDERQLLWLGTPFGVNWFDGKHFYEPPINARTGQLYITDFYTDNNKSIWTLTFYNGIYKFVNGKFINFLPQPDKLTSNRNNVFCMMQIDSSHYLVGTDENIFWFDGSSFSYFDKSNVLLNKQFNCIEKATPKNILLGSDNELWQYKLSGRKIISRQLVLNHHKVYNILTLANDIWVATNKGLYKYKKSDQLSVQAPQLYLNGQNVFSISEGKDGLWITTDKMYFLKDGLFSTYDESNGMPYPSANVFRDGAGITWITSPRGLSKLKNKYYRALDLRASKGHPMIICVEKNKNALWLGSYSGLTQLSEGRLQSMNEHKGQKLNYISWLKKLRNGDMLAGTEAGIIQIIGNKLHKKFDLISTKAFEDDSGKVWLGTIEGRLYMMDNNLLREIKLINSIPDFIDGIYKDALGYLWIGFRNNGIIKFKLNGPKAYAVKKYDQTNGFPDLRVRCSEADKDGRIIFGTRTNGMFIFSTVDDTYLQITTKNGLAGNWVKSISVDENNTIYAATNKGLNILNITGAKPVIRKVQLSENNADAPVNFVLAAKDSVWIGTDSGLVTYMPRLDIRDTAKPQVYLTQLVVNGKNDTTFLPYSYLKEGLTLAYNRNIIALRFDGVDLEGGDLNYTYRLKGQDNSWSEPNGNNTVNYNLPPGKYEFQAHAISKSGMKSVYPASLSFTILAPFWKTEWFLVVCILGAMSVFYSIYRYRLAQIIKIEKMRGRISADLHDDLGSGLSRIKFLSETIKLNKKQDVDFETSLEKISMYADEMSEKIGEIVWALNNTNDKLADLIAYLRSYTMEYLTNQGISCSAATPPVVADVIIDGEARRNIFLSVKEALFNIVKHAKADHVSLDISIRGPLQVIIHDNGIGIDLQNIRKFSNGLSNISNRMKQSRGTATFKREMGTKVILVIPLHT